jgi:signal peptidase I
VAASELARGDVILVRIDETEWIKRLIGLPNEAVELRDGAVWIDGQQIDESYEIIASEYDYGPITLGDNEYFVLGDDRNHSRDSRSFGAILADNIIGKLSE